MDVKKTKVESLDIIVTMMEDKIIKQLERRSVLSRPVGWTKSYEIVTLKDAIEIVKDGGVEK